MIKKLQGCIGFGLVLCFTMFSACDNAQDATVGNTNGTTGYSVAEAMNFRYSATKNESPTLSDHKAKYSFFDKENDYYMFYLGDITHIPLQDNASVYEYKGNDYSHSFTTTVTNVSTVSTMVSTMQEKCVENAFTLSIEPGFSIKGKVDLGLKAEYKNTTSYATTQEETYEKASEYSEENSETVTFEFNSSCKQGYYRYILLGDVEVFGVLVKNKASGEYYTDIYNLLVSQYFSLDYSTVSTFYDNNYGKLSFEMTEAEIMALETPTLSIEEVKEEQKPEEILDPEAYKNAEVVYNTGSYPLMVTDTGFTYDSFSIASLAPYLTNEYTLRFKIELYMREVDAGYQEIYLYNANGACLQGVSEYSYGGNGFANKTATWQTFDWTVEGSRCTEQMKMGYTAHAGGSDTWIIDDTKITVTVSKK